MSEDVRSPSPAVFDELSKPGYRRSVPKTKELVRIISIPRVVWTKEEMDDLALRMTDLLRRPGGTQTLRPIQAVALHDLAVHGGLISTARVGAGKTLITLLAPYVTECFRPLLIIPANLKQKTIRDIAMYRQHWEISPTINIESYEQLARSTHAMHMEMTRPDLIICDEAHHLKNTKAAVTKRLKRYLKDHPETKVVFLSGTLTNRSLKEYWHIVKWALPSENVPMPMEFSELDMWSLALDERVKPGQRVKAGGLRELFNDDEHKLHDEGQALAAARRAYRRRFAETPAIITTPETFEGADLTIVERRLKVPPIVQEAFKTLRDEWLTPDGWPIQEPTVAAKHAREIALGFYYRWNPRPPQEWLEKRKAWFKCVRKILTYNKLNLDTEKQVVDAVLAGHYAHKPQYREAYDEWKAVENTFEINTEPVWLHDFALQDAAKWMQENEGIVWVYHTAFGHKLSQMTGIPYYGEGGFSVDEKSGEKRFIEDHPASLPLIASITANREGKNLQKWSKNYIVSPSSSGKTWEQLIGRTHRDGQKADEVELDVVTSCIENVYDFWRAAGDAAYVQDTFGQVQKLLFASVEMVPFEHALADGDGDPVWTPSRVRETEE